MIGNNTTENTICDLNSINQVIPGDYHLTLR